MAEMHPSDAIVAVVGYYSGELRKLQGQLEVQRSGGTELLRQLEEVRGLHRSQMGETRDLLAERREVQKLLGVEEDTRSGALLEQVERKLRAAAPPVQI